MSEATLVEATKKYPPADSAKVDNTYYLPGCEVRQHSPSYAACLFKITETEKGRPQETWADCIGAISTGRCAAVDMRQKELLAGEALFYVPRSLIQRATPLRESAWNAALYRGQPKQVMQAAPQAPVVKKPASILDGIDAGSYASAINSAIAAPAPKSAKEMIAAAQRPGEALIDTARRLLAEKKSQITV